ncbi:hypothetical protein GDO81_019242 [Engystomops pustulosus]|uniref:Uncharacterized protein n=1 Tax=Engystomops pustulosus TaxID=76066 RepID=A0AAV6ZV13_ENGPU|nr:hypothetical protein GDO81_019242 [Engystomops pustulosus]
MWMPGMLIGCGFGDENQGCLRRRQHGGGGGCGHRGRGRVLPGNLRKSELTLHPGPVPGPSVETRR